MNNVFLKKLVCINLIIELYNNGNSYSKDNNSFDKHNN